ncbi:helix-turn-helix domain-containing protein [Flavivirga spongiicola]|uniref:Helix-turn-helix domain-containing protein n=1 Tax=Flavivirga spongiicola TaxID=421621 RepID=A0ABU7XWX2_9FLAO|nr:helix-turn-helix domain-containing protein [Flavivirga sp. MEBiC05379]MDO5980275.1 helix-turn-helix domain-containing protein [Flavivirga sp. MEBiC05379]
MQEITIRKTKEPLFSGNFEIINLGDLLVDKNMEEGLHRHDFFFLMVLEEASGKHHIDFNDYPVVPNTISLIRPGQVHELILEKGSKGYLITFDFNFYSSIYNYKKEIFWKVVQHNYYNLGNQKFGKILSVSKYIFDEFIQKKAGYEEVIKANLDILFIELMRDVLENNTLKEQNDPYEQELLDKFVQLLESQICTNKQVTEYSEMLHITPYKLNAITKNLLGKTSSQLINEQIILEAKRLLLATSNQINEIAFKLCYEDPAYFIRFFKRYTGYTPQVFRQNFK